MASHYLFEPEFCNPASGWEKGQGEKNVQDARRRLWQPMPSFPDIAALNVWLEEQCVAQWGQIQHGVLPGTVADAHAAEVASLMPLGSLMEDYADSASIIAQLDLVITVDTSVTHLAGALGVPVWLLVGQSSDWRWLLGREDSPWYPSMTVVRAPPRGGWAELLDTVAGRVRSKVGAPLYTNGHRA